MERVDIVIKPSLKVMFWQYWEKYRIILFSAPFGSGKTSVAHALLNKQNMITFNGEQSVFLEEPFPSAYDTILIDDFQYLRDETRQQKLCMWMRDNPKKHFVLLSRGVLPGWLMPFQFTGLLGVIGIQDLVFDRESTRNFLEMNHCTVSDAELTAILRDTEGYPLAMTSLVRHLTEGFPYSADVHDMIKRDLYHYIEDGVYRRFPTRLRQLLLYLAPFEEFDASVAKLVSGDSDIHEVLSVILHETTMLVNNGTEHYKFWPLFRQYLFWQIEQECSPEEQKDIYRQAGLYYALHNDYPHAMECYMQSGDHHKISELLIKNAQQHVGLGYYYEMERYYLAMPREEILRSPVLMSGMSMLTSLCMDYEASEQWYTELRNYAARLKKTDANYKEAKSRLLYLDIALPQRGVRDMAAIMSTAFHVMTSEGLKIPSFSVTSTLPSIMNGGKDFCEWSKKDDFLYATLRKPVEAVLGKDGVGLADCGICESKFEKGENVSSRVLALMSRVNEVQRKGTSDIWFAIIGLLARVQISQGKIHAALDTLERARENFIEIGETRFLPNLDAMKCRVWLRMGDMESVSEWMQQKAPSQVPYFRTLWRYQYLTKAMVQIANNEPEDALLTLAPLLPFCEHCGRVMDTIYYHVLTAICYHRLKNDAWKKQLHAALDSSCEYRFVMPIAQFGAAVLPLLNSYHWKKDAKFYQKIIAATREQTVNYPDFLRPATVLMTPLTPAELQVLKLICYNRSNQEIADILGVKLTTVKSQVRSILQKLDVSRRSEAKECAERLHLV